MQLVMGDLIDITNEANDCFVNGEYDKIGKLLDDSWKIKKQFASGVSNSLIDDMYSKALQAGALGGKILGAGGGGFLLLYVPEDKQDKVGKVLCDYQQIKFTINNDGSSIVYYD